MIINKLSFKSSIDFWPSTKIKYIYNTDRFWEIPKFNEVLVYIRNDS